MQGSARFGKHGNWSGLKVKEVNCLLSLEISPPYSKPVADGQVMDVKQWSRGSFFLPSSLKCEV